MLPAGNVIFNMLPSSCLIMLLTYRALCFQFSNLGPLEAHGFARNRFWSIDPSPPPFPVNSSNKTYVDLLLKSTEEDMKIWPHR